MDIKKKELNLIYCTIFFIVGIAYALLYLNGNMEGLIFALMPGIVLLILSMLFSSQIGIGDYDNNIRIIYECSVFTFSIGMGFYFCFINSNI